jgi:penicillin-binding protein 1C
MSSLQHLKSQQRCKRQRRWCHWLLTSLVVVFMPSIMERTFDAIAPIPPALLEAHSASIVISARDGTVLRWADRGELRQSWVPLADISPWLINALVAGEDRRFWEHAGVDVAAIARAALRNVQQGRRTSGASTLTMQLVRLLEPAPRTFSAKLREALRARQLERLLSKQAILEQYLNRVPWGGRLLGAEAASRTWFGCAARDLKPAEAAMLVAMLPAPSQRSPLRDARTLRDRRDRILRTMDMSPDCLREALAESLPRARVDFPWLAPHACDAALAQRSPATTLDHLRLAVDLQQQTHLCRALATAEVPGDGLAVVAVDVNGAVRVHLGSRDWRTQPFDAANTQRAAGSTLKPFLYRRALADDRLGQASVVSDLPFTSGNYRPENEDHRFLGDLTMSEALWRSRNPPAVRTLEAVGLDAFRDELGHAGLQVSVQGLDAALGTAAVSPIALAQAYAAILRRAQSHDEHAVAILSALRRVPLAPDVLSDEHIAWKTGTSSQRRDAWCVGIDENRIVVVWLGWCDGHGDARLRGRGDARRLCAQALAALRGSVSATGLGPSVGNFTESESLALKN